MSKKTFISNHELEVTQKIQLQFPRGVIPSEILTCWENCYPDVLRSVLMDTFYFNGDVSDPLIKVHRLIPLKYPHGNTYNGYFYFPTDTDQPGIAADFDVRDVKMSEVEEEYSESKKLLSFFNENKNLLEKQLDVYQLWAIYLRGYDFFIKYFHGKVYAVRSAYLVNGLAEDIYFPAIRIANDRKLEMTWYSSWNHFSDNDFLLSL